MSKINKRAKFWIRFLAKTIDALILCTVLVLILIGCVARRGGNFEFKTPALFYVWCCSALLLLILYFYVLPIFNNGQTVGFWIVGIKINYSESPWKEQALRETTFSFIYVLNIILLMSIINHTLIDAVIRTKNNTINDGSGIEKARVAFYTTITSIGVLVSTVVGISIIVKKGEGINDSMSNSQAVWTNKFIEVKMEKKTKIKYKPQPVVEELIEWIE